jgi:hypothetical protein
LHALADDHDLMRRGASLGTVETHRQSQSNGADSFLPTLLIETDGCRHSVFTFVVFANFP